MITVLLRRATAGVGAACVSDSDGRSRRGRRRALIVEELLHLPYIPHIRSLPLLTVACRYSPLPTVTGERAAVEEFLHYELVPSGNRVVVTSRPTGVNRELYDRYWVVIELLPLTNELQRKVIKMQMRGSLFFDHLMTLVRQPHRVTYGRTRLHAVALGHMRSHTVTYGHTGLHTVAHGYIRSHTVTYGYMRPRATTRNWLAAAYRRLRLRTVTCGYTRLRTFRRFRSAKRRRRRTTQSSSSDWSSQRPTSTFSR